jgi:putative amino-acid transport system permease protein
MQRIEKSFALVICLALNSAAYISESIRGAIEGVDPGQYEACVAFRLTKLESMYYVVLPQAAVSAIPPIMNSCLDIIKMSSLGMTIGIHDVMGRAQLAAATNYKTFETYLLAVMLYWLLAVALGSLQKKLEAKVNCAYKS